MTIEEHLNLLNCHLVFLTMFLIAGRVSGLCEQATSITRLLLNYSFHKLEACLNTIQKDFAMLSSQKPPDLPLMEPLDQQDF